MKEWYNFIYFISALRTIIESWTSPDYPCRHTFASKSDAQANALLLLKLPEHLSISRALNELCDKCLVSVSRSRGRQ